MNIFSVITLIGGLAFFLFGMNVMSGSLEKMAGGKLELLLKKMTANPIISLVMGAVITIAIQSSSATTVMMVGLVNSGIIPLTFADPADYDAINLLDEISLPNVLEEVKNGEQVTVVCGGRTFKADCEVSERQRHALLAGGTLLYARQQANK